jgi:hypothetical protein
MNEITFLNYDALVKNKQVRKRFYRKSLLIKKKESKLDKL